MCTCWAGGICVRSTSCVRHGQAATGQPAVLPEFFISFFDIDGDGDAVEHVSVSGYSAVVCHEDAYVITQVANTADVYSCMADDFTCAPTVAP